MSWTKRQFIEMAFEEIGLASYVFDLQPEQIEKALWKLDAMIEEWNAQGIRLGYPIPGSPESSDLDAETEVPDAANEAIYTNLGIRLAPAFGRQAMLETKVSANQSFKTLISRFSRPLKMQMPGTMPAGQGQRQWSWGWGPFLSPPVDPLSVGEDAPFSFD